MLVFLLAAQLSTTNCIPTVGGGQNCTTMGGNSHYVDTDWGAIFKARRDRKLKEHIGKFLAVGDCAGAEQYALQKGELDLAQQVKGYCAK